MATKCPKMAEINLGVPHMINDIIFNILGFSTFSLGYFTNPVFWPNSEKIGIEST